MPTIAGGTVGAGGTYPTWAAWKAAAPLNLVTADVIWQGRQLPGELVVAGNAVTISGHTTDATHYFEMTTEPGASFADHASKATNPLRYDATKGAAIRMTGDYSVAVLISQSYTRVSGLQIIGASTGANSAAALQVTAPTGCELGNLIVESFSVDCTAKLENDNKLRNSVVIQRRQSASLSIAKLTNGAQVHNVTMVATGTPPPHGITTQYAAAILKNCYIGGATATRDAGPAPTIATCFSDVATSGFSTAPLSASTFVSTTDGTHDFRLATGSALINAGTAVAESGATDVFGNPRTVGPTMDVGAAEYQTPSAADTTAPILSVPAATATSSTTATGTVATDEGGGVLFYMASANATETETTLLAAASQAVMATGAQTVSFTGLTAGTTYYPHYLHRDAALNKSAVANGTSFATPVPDTVAPAFAGGSAITPGTITSSSVAFSYPAATDNVAVTGYQTSKDSGATWGENGTGLNGTFTGLTASTTYPIWVRAKDAAGNFSTPLQTTMTTSAAATGSITTDVMTSSGTLRASVACTYTWFLGGVIGTTTGAATHGSGTTAAGGALTAAGLPKGAGYLMVKFADGGICYQAGTVA